MKFLIFLIFLLSFSVAHAETYKWQDENGMHFIDNASSIPSKYREKVLEEARQNSPDKHSTTASPFPGDSGISPQVTIPGNNYQPNFERKPYPSTPIKPPQFPTYLPKRAHAPSTMEEALLPFAKFMTAIIGLSVVLFVVWLFTL
jgi:hypothetical protein